MLQLIDFLRERSPAAIADITWGRSGIQLRVSSYLDAAIPPKELITSVRAVVLKSEQVVVLENFDGRHYLPGGRVETGETFLEALSREIEEECGLRIESAELMGFVHLRHTTPRPVDYPYPYPDMIHLIYLTHAVGEVRSGDIDGYEEAAFLLDPVEASKIEGTEFAQPFLHRATGA